MTGGSGAKDAPPPSTDEEHSPGKTCLVWEGGNVRQSWPG